jgi:hypothetical protein
MVQRQLGHADLRMTLGTYGHLFPDWTATSLIACRNCGSERKQLDARPGESPRGRSPLSKRPTRAFVVGGNGFEPPTPCVVREPRKRATCGNVRFACSGVVSEVS